MRISDLAEVEDCSAECSLGRSEPVQDGSGSPSNLELVKRLVWKAEHNGERENPSGYHVQSEGGLSKLSRILAIVADLYATYGVQRQV